MIFLMRETKFLRFEDSGCGTDCLKSHKNGILINKFNKNISWICNIVNASLPCF